MVPIGSADCWLERFTDAAASTFGASAAPAATRSARDCAMRDAADATFNCLTTDGATSTNDTVMLFASGRKGRPADMARFADDVRQVCEELMLKMARDAEGMTKLVTIHVTGAASEAEARHAARSIGNNQLIKCSWYGADAYWGRLLAEAGSCGAEFNSSTASVTYGGVCVARSGVEISHDNTAVAAHMRGDEIDILVDLGLGAHAGVEEQHSVGVLDEIAEARLDPGRTGACLLGRAHEVAEVQPAHVDRHEGYSAMKTGIWRSVLVW